MIVTTYTCDKCGHGQEDPNQMWRIGIILDHYNKHEDKVPAPAVRALWCRKCVESSALLPQGGGAKDAPPPPDPPPTLEDMVREIVQQEMVPRE